MEELRNGKRSTLQVVRVTCLAARVGRDAAALALGGRVQWQSRCVASAERQADMGLLDLVLLCGRRWRRLVGLLLLLLLLLLPLARRVVRGRTVAFLSFLTTSVDAPGEQSTSVFVCVNISLRCCSGARIL